MIAITLFVFIMVSVLYLLLPFGREVLWSYGKGEDLLRLQERKEAALVAIHDVDFEYAAGKISEEDYRELRSYYKEEAINILKELDVGLSPDPGKGINPDLQRDLKKEIIRLKGLKEAV